MSDDEKPAEPPPPPPPKPAEPTRLEGTDQTGDVFTLSGDQGSSNPPPPPPKPAGPTHEERGGGGNTEKK
jgi:hypothetical protein